MAKKCHIGMRDLSDRTDEQLQRELFELAHKPGVADESDLIPEQQLSLSIWDVIVDPETED